MRHIYIDSCLHSLTLAGWYEAKQWIFSQGRPWLLLTPRRLSRIAVRLGIGDRRVERLVNDVRRHSATPCKFYQALGMEEVEPYYAPGEYPPALCPVCDHVHNPHPLDAYQPCPPCRESGRADGLDKLSPVVARDREASRTAIETLRKNNPDSFCEGKLRPNWQYNFSRRLHRDWDAAVNRILMGGTYRTVAKEFNCSVGLLHKKVQEQKFWENN